MKMPKHLHWHKGQLSRARRLALAHVVEESAHRGRRCRGLHEARLGDEGRESARAGHPGRCAVNEPRLECIDCMSAAAGVHHGFTQGCDGCKARAASRSPHFARVRKLGSQDRAYRALLEQFGLTHEQVKGAAAKDAAQGTV